MGERTPQQVVGGGSALGAAGIQAGPHGLVNHQSCLSSSTEQETPSASSPPKAGSGLSRTPLPEPPSLPGPGTFSRGTGTATLTFSGPSVVQGLGYLLGMGTLQC